MVRVTLIGGKEGPVVVIADKITITTSGIIWANFMGGQMSVGQLQEVSSVEVEHS